MIYISKGIVQERSTERNIYVGRGGQVFQLTKIESLQKGVTYVKGIRNTSRHFQRI